MKRYAVVSACLLIAFLMLRPCFAAELIVVGDRAKHSEDVSMISAVAAFYGLEVVNINPADKKELTSKLKAANALALVTSYDSLSALNPAQVKTALQRPGASAIPIMIFGVPPHPSKEVLDLWADLEVDCASFPAPFRPTALAVSERGTLTRQLSGMELPAVAAPVCRLELTPRTEPVLVAHDGSQSAAVLVRIESRRHPVFVSPEMTAFDESWRVDPMGLPRAFSRMSPFILFISNAAGEYGWHFAGHYANLTIDDAWLTPSFGHLAYGPLLEEMKKHNFHTTVAFIPWNFDRSDSNVVALFRSYPERYSICIHGDDHAHQEFGAYRVNSLNKQTEHIKQGVARMERFHALTGLEYDRFMVFPHGVAPEPTFAELKKYNFLGTANSSNVPMGSSVPSDPGFFLRPVTLSYGDFASFLRYPATTEIPKAEIAIHAFLGNPLLFYGHENMFNSGIGAFNRFADYVNQVQPDTKWASLATIARRTYLIRTHDASQFDILMMSNQAEITNPSDHDAVFRIMLNASPSLGIDSLTIGGVKTDFARSQNTVTTQIMIPARQARRVELTYANDLDIQHQAIGRLKNPYAFSLRLVSDFRDLYMSRYSLGRSLRDVYYRRQFDATELLIEEYWWVGVLLIITVVLPFRLSRRRKPGMSKSARHNS